MSIFSRHRHHFPQDVITLHFGNTGNAYANRKSGEAAARVCFPAQCRGTTASISCNLVFKSYSFCGQSSQSKKEPISLIQGIYFYVKNKNWSKIIICPYRIVPQPYEKPSEQTPPCFLSFHDIRLKGLSALCSATAESRQA